MDKPLGLSFGTDPTSSLTIAQPPGINTAWKHDIIIMDPSNDRPLNHCSGDEYRSISNGKRVITEMDFFAVGSCPKPKACIIKKECIEERVEQQNEDDVNVSKNSITCNIFISFCIPE